jgi:GNAT superfamily N-acetyltransferase
MVTIDEVGFSRRDRRRFVDVEFRLNRSDPLWTPPLRADRMKYLDPRRNPFFEHAEVAHFVAVRDGKDAGRIAALRNRRHEEFHEEPVGFFGFFETADDENVAVPLLERAVSWVRERGLPSIRGPVSYDTNQVSGALVGPFDKPVSILTAYNRPHVPKYIVAAGFTKAKDLHAYVMFSDRIPERIRRLSDRLRKKEGIRIRDFCRKEFAAEVRLVKEIYRSAWEKNWGFVPPTEAEFDYLAADMKHVLDPEFVFFGMVGEDVVGFAMALPDANQAIHPVRSGRLLPFGILRILRGWKRIDMVRIIILGVTPEYRNRGLELLFYREMFDRALRRGLVGGEASWILEDNVPMVKGIEALGGELVRTWRIYERPSSLS